MNKRAFYKKAFQWDDSLSSKNKAGRATQNCVKIDHEKMSLLRHKDKLCYYCGSDCYKHGYTRDHIIPRCEGGKDTVTCCGPCNQLKGRLRIEEFRLVLAFRSKKIESIKATFKFFGETI